MNQDIIILKKYDNVLYAISLFDGHYFQDDNNMKKYGCSFHLLTMTNSKR